MEFTKRDITLLNTIHRNGVLSNEQVREIYGHPSKYHLKRLVKLCQEGYVTRSYGYVQITSKGMAAAGIMGNPKRFRKIDLRRRVELLDALKRMPEWSATLTAEVKERRRLNRAAYIDAYIEKDGIGYAVYLIDTKTIKPVTLGRLWNEIQELPLKGLSHVLMLFEYTEAMGLMVSKINKPQIDRLLLLPYPGGIELFIAYHSKIINGLIQEKLTGVEPLDRKRRFADYQCNGYYVTVLLANDAIKRYYLGQYYDGLGYQTEKKDVIIICTSDQRNFFGNMYPRARIVDLDRSHLTENNT